MPTNVRVLHGETRPCKLNRNEPKPSDKPISCPAWLSPQAKREWKRLAPELVRLGVLTHLDRDSLAVYCEAVVHYRAAAELVDHSAVLVKGDKDRLVKNPALQILRDQAAIIRGFARELGLTPSSRSGIAVPEAEDALVSELLSGSKPTG